MNLTVLTAVTSAEIRFDLGPHMKVAQIRAEKIKFHLKCTDYNVMKNDSQVIIGYLYW